MVSRRGIHIYHELCTHHSFSTVSVDSMLHVIEQEHCLRCRNCLEVCPPQIEKQSIYIEMETERKR